MDGVIIKEKAKEAHRKIIDEYLNKVYLMCDKVRLFSSSTYAAEAPIYNLYVQMPTNIYVDVEIKNSEIVKIWERYEYDSDLEKYSKDAENLIEYSCEKKEKIQSKIKELVDSGKEYLYPDITKRPLIISTPWSDGVKEKYWLLSTLDIISLYDKVVLLGGPGSGKSTTLHYLAINLINNYFNEHNDNNISSLSVYLFDEKFIPIYIEMRDFSKWIKHNKRKSVNICEIKDYILEFMKKDWDFEVINAFWKKLKESKILFLLDGLDEIYFDEKQYSLTKEKLNGVILQLQKEFGGCKILLSSRINEYKEFEVSDFKVAKLVSMDQYKIAELIEKIYNYSSKSINDEQVNEFIEEMKEKNLKEDIIGNPLLLSLIVAIAMKNPTIKERLPNEKSQILFEGIKLLIERWYSGEELPPFFEAYSSDEILQKLKRFAYNTNENGLISYKELFMFLKADKNNSNEILDYLVRRAGLIIQKGEEYEFAHKSFRSYLAASHIVESEDCLKYLTGNNYLKQYETVSLAVDILFDKIKDIKRNDNSIATLWNVISLLVDDNNNNSEWDIWFAGKILSNRNYLLLNAHVYFQNEIIGALKEKLLEVFGKAIKDFDLEKRLECGIILGQLGDTRNGVGVYNDIPDIKWCFMEEGEFTYGIESPVIDKIRETMWGKDCDFSRELPTQKLKIQSFYMSQYPVTVAQFKCFLSDDQGYYCDKWYKWSQIAMLYYNEKICGKSFYLDAKQDVDNYPITNVSFIEAVAFCKWFSEKTGDLIRLPSEAEWEYAAKKQGLIFPWGDEYKKELCNGYSTNVGQICPVGSFYHTSSDIPVDMCGNTWEWTQSFYLETHMKDDDNSIININNNEMIKKEHLISDRGGSFLNGPNCMRTSFRGRDPVDAAADRHGFRVIKSIEPFKGRIEEVPSCPQQGMECEQGFCERKGYGPVVKVNDNILVWYQLFNEETKEYLERSITYRFVLGTKKIHEVLDKMLINSRVASFFIVRVQADECFGNRTFGKVKPSNMLRFEISIMDIEDTN